MKIVFLGAGSTVFARNVIGDCMCVESLRDSEFALYDIDSARLEESRVILSAMQKEKGYIRTVSSYIKAFHNLPRAFLSITDKSRISPAEAIDYSKSYLKLD